MNRFSWAELGALQQAMLARRKEEIELNKKLLDYVAIKIANGIAEHLQRILG